MNIVDFSSEIQKLYEVYKNHSAEIATEESTKMSLIVPFFQMLGYDVFNPREFYSEYVADVGVKSGEKVDYCIYKGGLPSIIIECKHHKEKNLDKHVSQLFRYFTVSPVKLGILTNGVEYRFYTDTEQVNIMDKEPFYILKTNNVTSKDLQILKLFTKEEFCNENIAKAINLQKEYYELARERDIKIKLFFEKQEEYINSDYANLLYNLIFNRDIPKQDMGYVIKLMKEACHNSKIKVEQPVVIKQEYTEKIYPVVNDIALNTETTLSLYDTVKNRVDLSFTKISLLKNSRTGKQWEINSWGMFLEILVLDLLDNGVSTQDILTLDGCEVNDGWIRNVYVENRLTTQRFKEIKRGLYLNTYGNAVAMIQKLYKACTDFPNLMGSYYINIIKNK